MARRYCSLVGRKHTRLTENKTLDIKLNERMLNIIILYGYPLYQADLDVFQWVRLLVPTALIAFQLAGARQWLSSTHLALYNIVYSIMIMHNKASSSVMPWLAFCLWVLIVLIDTSQHILMTVSLLQVSIWAWTVITMGCSVNRNCWGRYI